MMTINQSSGTSFRCAIALGLSAVLMPAPAFAGPATGDPPANRAGNALIVPALLESGEHRFSAVPKERLLLVKSRRGAKSRGRGARSGKRSRSYSGQRSRSYSRQRSRNRGHARERYRDRSKYRHTRRQVQRRHYRSFRFRGREEECYTGRLIFPDRFACGHPYNYHYRK